MGFVRGAVAPLAGLLITLALVVASRGLDAVARGDQLGPGFWPRLVLGGLGLACLAKLAAEWRRAALGERLPDAAARALEPAPEISRWRLGAAMLLIVLYVVATPWIGFPLATAGFIVGFMRLCGTRARLAIGANALIGTVALLYLFIKLVYLPLPKGEGPFEGLTLALYRGLGIL